MGLKGNDEFSFEQPDLGPNNIQLKIIDGLNILAEELIVDQDQYDIVQVVIDDEVRKLVQIDIDLENQIKEEEKLEAFQQYAKNLVFEFQNPR